MVLIMMVTLIKIIKVGMEKDYMKMVIFILDLGKMILEMVKVNIFMKMAISIKVPGSMILKMVMVFLLGQIQINMKETG